jgi:hypothetical protein
MQEALAAGAGEHGPTLTAAIVTSTSPEHALEATANRPQRPSTSERVSRAPSASNPMKEGLLGEQTLLVA